jgi:hypothetical protein
MLSRIILCLLNAVHNAFFLKTTYYTVYCTLSGYEKYQGIYVCVRGRNVPQNDEWYVKRHVWHLFDPCPPQSIPLSHDSLISCWVGPGPIFSSKKKKIHLQYFPFEGTIESAPALFLLQFLKCI